MLRMQNEYCRNCLSTQRFLDLGASLVCERCTARLYRVADRPAPHPEGQIAAVRAVPESLLREREAG